MEGVLGEIVTTLIVRRGGSGTEHESEKETTTQTRAAVGATETETVHTVTANEVAKTGVATTETVTEHVIILHANEKVGAGTAAALTTGDENTPRMRGAVECRRTWPRNSAVAISAAVKKVNDEEAEATGTGRGPQGRRWRWSPRELQAVARVVLRAVIRLRLRKRAAVSRLLQW